MMTTENIDIRDRSMQVHPVPIQDVKGSLIHEFSMGRINNEAGRCIRLNQTQTMRVSFQSKIYPIRCLNNFINVGDKDILSRRTAGIPNLHGHREGRIQFWPSGYRVQPEPCPLIVTRCCGARIKSRLTLSLVDRVAVLRLLQCSIGCTSHPVHIPDCLPKLISGNISTAFHRIHGLPHRNPLKADKQTSDRQDRKCGSRPFQSGALESVHLIFNLCEMLFGCWLGWKSADWLGYLDWKRTSGGFAALFGGLGIFAHGGVSVTQKVLDPCYFTYYNKYMANVLGTDKQIGIIGALCEGSSIRSIERTSGVHRDTIMRLGVKVGKGCTALMDAKMRNLDCHRLEMDEIWGYVGKKEKHVRPGDDPQFGNVWTFCAIDADTKLVPTFRVSGGRDVKAATAFVLDVADRMKNRVQISTDGLAAYVEAIDWAFGRNVDYGQIIKVYGTEESVEAQRRYSAPKITTSEKKAVFGRPNFDLISTSYVERLNATTRLHMKRLARLTHAFSKKRENFEAAVGLHFAYYNFVRRHNTLRCTPAMAAGVEQSFWSVGELLEAVA